MASASLASPPNDADVTLPEVVESGEHITETAPVAPAIRPADSASALNVLKKKTRFKDQSPPPIDVAWKPPVAQAATYTPDSTSLDIYEGGIYDVNHDSYDVNHVLPYSGVLVSKESTTEGPSQWPWSNRHRLEILGLSPGGFAGAPPRTSLHHNRSQRKTGGENSTQEGGRDSLAPPHVEPPKSPKGGGLDGLPPPPRDLKTVVRLMVVGEWAEEANGYMLLTMVALAVGSFGGDLTPLSFWLINAVALLEVALKLLRNWSDAFKGVKCCDVASQWDAFWGLKWSIRTRALAVVVQLGLYGAMARNVAYGDRNPDGDEKLNQVEKVITAFLVLHWVLGLWVLLMELRLFMRSKIRLLLLVPGFGARRFVEVMTALALGFISCVSGTMWHACLQGRWGDIAHFFDWVSDMGDNPYGLEGLPALTWYVHSRRHPMLRGYAAKDSDECGLTVDWTLDFKELISLFWKCHQGMIRVSPSAQKWALDGIERRVKKWASELKPRKVKKRAKKVEGGGGSGQHWVEEEVEEDSIGLDGLILLDAVLVIPKGQEEIFEELTPKVARLLVDEGVVERSLKATVALACAGSDRQKELNVRTRERLAQRLMMLGEKLEDVGKWEMALTLHKASKKLRKQSKAPAKGLARSYNCIAWTMTMALSAVDGPKRPPAEVEMELKSAEKKARQAVAVGEAGGVSDWDMAIHLATLAHVLKKMRRTEEAHAMLEEAEELWKRSKEKKKRTEEKSEYAQWPQSKKRKSMRRTVTKFWSKLITEVDNLTKHQAE